jgi:hypothetical protein
MREATEAVDKPGKRVTTAGEDGYHAAARIRQLGQDGRKLLGLFGGNDEDEGKSVRRRARSTSNHPILPCLEEREEVRPLPNPEMRSVN